MSQTQYLSISISCGTAQAAGTLGRALVEAGLAACTQTHPVTSIYRWQGAVAQEGEVLLEAKALAGRFAEICDFVEARHDYDVPQITGTPLTHIAPAYARWLAETLGA